MGEFDGKFHQVCLSSSKNHVTGEVGRCCTQQQTYQERNGKIMLNRRLVGGFNPFEKYARQMGNLPQIGVKIPKIFELPTPSRPWNNPENWHAPKRAIHCHPLCSPSILFFSMATPTYPSCRERNQSITTTHIPQKGSKSNWWNKWMCSPVSTPSSTIHGLHPSKVAWSSQSNAINQLQCPQNKHCLL